MTKKTDAEALVKMFCVSSSDVQSGEGRSAIGVEVR